MALGAVLGSGQTTTVPESSRVEITLPASVASERLLYATFLTGRTWAVQCMGQLTFPHSELAPSPMATLRRMKAILYAPGCEIQTLDLKLTGSDAVRYSYTCQRVPDLK